MTKVSRDKKRLHIELGTVTFDFVCDKKKKLLELVQLIENGRASSIAADSKPVASSLAPSPPKIMQTSMPSPPKVTVSSITPSPPKVTASSTAPSPPKFINNQPFQASNPITPEGYASPEEFDAADVIPQHSMAHAHVPPAQVPQQPYAPESDMQPAEKFLARALFDYRAESQNDLDLVEGDLVHVLDATEDEWWLVRNNLGEMGHVPAQYLDKVREESVATKPGLLSRGLPATKPDLPSRSNPTELSPEIQAPPLTMRRQSGMIEDQDTYEAKPDLPKRNEAIAHSSNYVRRSPSPSPSRESKPKTLSRSGSGSNSPKRPPPRQANSVTSSPPQSVGRISAFHSPRQSPEQVAPQLAPRPSALPESAANLISNVFCKFTNVC